MFLIASVDIASAPLCPCPNVDHVVDVDVHVCVCMYVSVCGVCGGGSVLNVLRQFVALCLRPENATNTHTHTHKHRAAAL